MLRRSSWDRPWRTAPLLLVLLTARPVHFIVGGAPTLHVGEVDAATGTVTDEAGWNRLHPLVHVNNFAIVEFDWEQGAVSMSLIKAERTQLQRTADNGAVLQSITIELSELVGEGW